MKRKITKKLMALLLSFCLALGCVPVQTNAGVFTNIVTGKFKEIGFDYLERAIMFGLNKAISNTENENVAQALTLTKKLLASPLGNSLSKLTTICQDISSDLNSMSVAAEQNIVATNQALAELMEKVSGDTYSTYLNNDIRPFYNKYLYIYNDYMDLAEAVLAYSDDMTAENLDKVDQCYYYISQFYETDTDPHTSTEFNFESDLSSFLIAISPYNYGQAIDYSVDPSDESAWGSKSGGDTFLDAAHDYFTAGYAFEDDIYASMVACLNEATAYVATYLTVYRLYVEFGTQQISSDPSVTDADKKVTALWDGYNKCAYMAMRGLAQMFSLYEDELMTLMRPYDRDVTLYSGYYDGSNEYKSTMEAYHVKVYGTDDTYYIVKNDGSTTVKDLSGYQEKTISGDTYEYYGPLAPYLSIQNAYVNDSPHYAEVRANMITSTSDLTSILESNAYKLNNSLMVSFLKNQGMTQILSVEESTKVSTDENDVKEGPFLLTDNYYLDIYEPEDVTYNWIDISQPITVTTGNSTTASLEAEGDLNDNSAVYSDQQFLAILKGEDEYYTLENNTARVNGVFSKVYYEENGELIDADINDVPGGAKVTLKIGQGSSYDLKSLYIVDESGNVLFDYLGTVTNENVDPSEVVAGLSTDEDGFFTIQFSMPYRNISIEASASYDATAEYTATLTADEEDRGLIYFADQAGAASKTVDEGTTITVDVRPYIFEDSSGNYTGYVSSGLKITDTSGNEIKWQDITDQQDNKTTPGTKTYEFIMPSKDVTITPVLEPGYVVSFLQNANGTVSLIDENSYDYLNDSALDSTNWLLQPIAYSAGETVKIKGTAASGYCMDELYVTGLSSADQMDIHTLGVDSVEFTMPSENVAVSAEFVSIIGKHVAAVEECELGYIKFHDTDSPSKSCETGETVEFTVYPDYEGLLIESVTVKQYNSKTGKYDTDVAVNCTDSENYVYSFEMPNANVRIYAKLTGSLPELVDGYYQLVIPAHLVWFSEQVNSGNTHICGQIRADIDMSKVADWTPIGTADQMFEGSFDGGHYEISGLCHSLFGTTRDADIEKVVITDSAITAHTESSQHVGSIIGTMLGGTLKLSSSEAFVSATSQESNLGGLVGNACGTITDCYFAGSASGYGNTGGLLGSSNSDENPVTVSNCYVYSAEISGGEYTANLVGYFHTGSVIENCYYNAMLLAEGIAGYMADYPSTLNDAFEFELNALRFTKQFENGRVTLDLNKGEVTDVIWYQTLGVDEMPQFSGKVVDLEGDNSFQKFIPEQDENGVYLIKNYRNLLYMMLASGSEPDTYGTKTYRLMNNIDCEGNGWISIPTFAGVLDGNGYSISNLVIRSDLNAESTGLITKNSGTIKNLILRNVTCTDSSSAYVGAIAGQNYGTITCCAVDSSTTVWSGNYAGGIAGLNKGNIIDCANYATVQGVIAGGIVGRNERLVNNSMNLGTIKSTENSAETSYIGGIIGENDTSSYSGTNKGVWACYSSGTMENSDSGYAGGIIGRSCTADNRICFYDSDVWPNAIGLDESNANYISIFVMNGEGMKTQSFCDTMTQQAESLDAGEWGWNQYLNQGYPYLKCLEGAAYESLEPNEEGIYEIDSYEDLFNLAYMIKYEPETYAGESYVQTANIRCNQEAWKLEIGIAGAEFNGEYNGSGYYIVGLRPSSSVSGLFGVIGTEGVVKDLYVLDFDYETAAEIASGFAGINYGTIDGCGSGMNLQTELTIKRDGVEVSAMTLDSDIKASVIGGGLVAVNEGTIKNSYNNAEVTIISGSSTEDSYAGGIAGKNAGTILNIYQNGVITGGTYAGGIAGLNSGSIQYGYNSAVVTGTTAGAIVGVSENDDINGFFYNSEMTVASGSHENDELAVTAMSMDEMKTQDLADKLNALIDGQDLSEWTYDASQNDGYQKFVQDTSEEQIRTGIIRGDFGTVSSEKSDSEAEDEDETKTDSGKDNQTTDSKNDDKKGISSDRSGVNTGDETIIWPFVALLLISVIWVVVIAGRKHRSF